MAYEFAVQACDNRPMNEKTTHFGFRDVPLDDKKKLVGEVFSSVAAKYDVMNDLMSLGVHRLWKRYFTGTSGIKRGDRMLDLAGGTGDIAKLLLERVGETGEIIIGDINPDMLRVGRDRLTDLGLIKGLSYVQLNAEALPFPDNSFDAITMAFGLRNVTDKPAALKSMHRILKPGGKAMVLEFSEVQAEWFKPIYDFHSFKVLPKLGELIADDADSYRYLAESIRRHPNQAGLKAMMEEAGFEQCAVRNLSGGIVAIHSGFKI
jgi:demethylmenaquinone methyltransferase / 2-methoxy-6-polyprenyl-1,4-benzoquinol methylase